MSINEHVDQGKHRVGKTELLRFLNGEHITYKERIKAKCYECMGYYEDGLIDCGCIDCPLYGVIKREK